MAELEATKHDHYCYKCGKKLFGKDKHRISGPSMRINFEGHKYCIPCGYFKIYERIEGLQMFNNKLKDKYAKEIVMERLVNAKK